MRLIIDNSECWIKNVELPLNFNSMTYYGKLFYIYNNYLFHKLDGPARAFFSGAKYWYLDGLIVDEKIYQKIQHSSKEELLVYMIDSKYKKYFSLIEYELNKKG